MKVLNYNEKPLIDNVQYKKYLTTQDWRKKADARLLIDHKRCQMCGCSGTSVNPLQVHHLTYNNIYRENPDKDLVTLCKSCHTSVHTMMNRITNSETGQRGWKDTIVRAVYANNIDGIHQEYIFEERKDYEEQ